VAAADSFMVYAYFLYNPGGGWQMDPTHQPRLITTTTLTSIPAPSLPAGMYLYGVKAKNCAGISAVIQTKKDKQ
jgi:hypothetical protein